jgi:hypothetical protein
MPRGRLDSQLCWIGTELTPSILLAGMRDSQGGFSMKQCCALALLVCLSATGCVSTGLLGPKCGDACCTTTNKRAPRPLLTRNASRPDGRMFGKGCGGDGCPVGNCLAGCNCDGCASGGPCQHLAGKIAGGFCACPATAGICPHAGGYPEQPAFQPGPPTGQVAYPYYTTRGPRDFLLKNPPSIGPY